MDRNQRQQCDQHEPAQLQSADVNAKRLLGNGILDHGGNVVGVCGGVDGLYDDRSGGNAQHIHGRADDGLIRLEIDGCHSQQAGVQHAHQSRCQQHPQAQPQAQPHEGKGDRLRFHQD